VISIIDIDGTVADNSHREGFLQSTKKDWDSFYRPELVMADRPIAEAQRALPIIIKSSFATFFLTGRPERLRRTTEDWMSQHFGIRPWPVLPELNQSLLEQAKRTMILTMRGDKDHRPAHIYKEELCKALVGSHTLLFFDDDLRNKEMYNLYGVFMKAPECFAHIVG
jgi:hypothetical protein